MVKLMTLICTIIVLVRVECTIIKTSDLKDTLRMVQSDPKDTLRMVHVLFRHGDRAPLKLYPNDPYKNISSEIWPEGLGQLTRIGKAMSYKLGLWLRKSYDGFIKRVFDTKEIKVISTDFDRTLMTAEGVMAAFYYPNNKTEFKEDLMWVPTPIHTAPNEYDKLLATDSSCPGANLHFAKLKTLPEIQVFNKKNEELYKYIYDTSGNNVTSIIDVLLLFDTLRIERLYNLTIPYWALKVYNEMRIASNFFYEMYSYTRELKRFRGGPLLRNVIENMRKKSLGNLPERKMLVYSGHDSTVSAFLNTMGVYNSIAPPYVATVMVELHQTENDYFVKIYYQNDTSFSNPSHELTLPGCSLECPLNDWIDLLKDVVPQDWEKECHDTDRLQNHSNISAHTGISRRGKTNGNSSRD